MKLRFSSRQVTIMVVAFCCAVIAAPVAVFAATQINISDPQSSSRMARVSSDGFLRVESRAAAEGSPFNVAGAANTGLSFQKLYEATGPKRIAITDLQISSDTYINANNPQYTTRVEIISTIRTSGTNPCAYNQTGWTRKTLRWVDVSAGRTEQLTFAGSPLLVKAETGQRMCIGYMTWVLPTNTTVFGAVSGYTYSP